MISTATGQTPNPITLTVKGGLNTSQLTMPTPVTVIPICSGGGCTNTWNYWVVAVDAGGGTTDAASGTTNMGTTYPPTTSAYNLVVTAPVIGSVTCNIYRKNNTGGAIADARYIANVPCGSTYIDNSTPTPGDPVPLVNTTGSVSATMVTAQTFNAKGSGAGTEILTSGSPLSFCPGTPPPPNSCIPAIGAVFQQAPSGFSTPSWGFTLPSSPPTSPGPFIFGTATGATFNSTVTIPTLNDNQAVNGSASLGLATGFSDTPAAGSVTVGHLAAYTATNIVGNCVGTPCTNTIGVFTSLSGTSATWIASGEATVTLDSSTGVVGDILCNSSSGSVAHDNGSVSCASGQWVGFVKTGGSGSVIAFISLR